MEINILEETAASIFCPESIMSAAIKMITVTQHGGSDFLQEQYFALKFQQTLGL
jgi:hypothetical protein